MNMEKSIRNIRHINNTFVSLLDSLTVEQLNAIPVGFSNNIIWNFIHLLAVQQAVFYLLSGLPPTVDNAIIQAYRRGTKPESNLTESEIVAMKQTFADAINTLENDYGQGIFTNYKRYETSFGVVLENIDDAIQFSSVHDGLHLGYARALRRLV